MRPPARSPQELWVCHLGTVGYGEALAIQEHVRSLRLAEALPDTLLMLEHPPVYTRGRRSGARDLPFGEDFYRAKGIAVHSTDRGGQLTYHGPGQLVGYPIMRIDDVQRFLRTMEEAIIAALAREDVQARSRRSEGINYTGVWVAARKIASIGVHVAYGVSTHGFAVNVENDLEPFSWVIACGLPDVSMTSLARERRASACQPLLACFRKHMAHSFAQAHGLRQRLVSPRRLGIDTANASRRATKRAPINTTTSAPAETVPV
ncbi:MAG: lipoyl(octanoyl) transferase LipB [Solirubrobacteraceae bacterium]